MSKIIPLRLTEIEEEDETDLSKEVGDAYPRFEFEPFGSANGRFIVVVNVNGNFIGSVSRRGDQWHISFVEARKMHTHIPIASKEEGAEKLWQDRLGIIQLPEIKPPREPLEPVPDDPNHYESFLKTASKLVTFLAEEEPDDDFEDGKDYAPDQLDMIVTGLEAGGFKMIRADRTAHGLVIEFTWPSPTAMAYVNGWKRATEIIKPYMPLRHDNYTVTRDRTGKTNVTTALIVKRAEENPDLWKVVPMPGAGSFNAHSLWHDILFAGKKQGQAYLPSFSPGGDLAERLREELSELNDIVPFDPNPWYAPGNEWGRGPAIEWWRANRSKLSNADRNKHFFDRSLIGE